ncbi:MAG: hypothetical protein IPN83_19910 [Holophagales bacterium]|nr:hypothetical protein [Holophagales bacterium]
METIVFVISALAITVMAIDLYLALQLKKAIGRGDLGKGEVAKKWNLLTALLVVFFVGYLASPLLVLFKLDPAWGNVLVFTVFLLGAGFVFLVVGVLKDILTVLDVLK